MQTPTAPVRCVQGPEVSHCPGQELEHRGRLTMPLTVRTEPHFLPVGETTGSGQEGGICARLAAAIYCLSGDLFLLLVCCQAHWDEWC